MTEHVSLKKSDYLLKEKPHTQNYVVSNTAMLELSAPGGAGMAQSV
jgi:hypothetical protein